MVLHELSRILERRRGLGLGGTGNLPVPLGYQPSGMSEAIRRPSRVRRPGVRPIPNPKSPIANPKLPAPMCFMRPFAAKNSPFPFCASYPAVSDFKSEISNFKFPSPHLRSSPNLRGTFLSVPSPIQNSPPHPASSLHHSACFYLITKDLQLHPPARKDISKNVQKNL